VGPRWAAGVAGTGRRLGQAAHRPPGRAVTPRPRPAGPGCSSREGSACLRRRAGVRAPARRAHPAGPAPSPGARAKFATRSRPTPGLPEPPTTSAPHHRGRFYCGETGKEGRKTSSGRANRRQTAPPGSVEGARGGGGGAGAGPRAGGAGPGRGRGPAGRGGAGPWAGPGRGRGPAGRGRGGAEGRRGGGPRSGRSAAWAWAVAAAAAAAAGEDAAVPGRQLVRAPGGAAPLGLVLRLPGARLPALPGVRRRSLLVGGAALRGPAAPGAAQAEAALPGGARVPVGAAARAVLGPRAGGQQLRRVGAQQRLGQLELGLHLRALLRQHRAVHHRLWPHRALVRWRPVLYFHVRWGFSKQMVAIVHAVLLGFVTVSCFFFIPAAVFSILEDDWNFLESFYFCFISLSTIGLGDYVPGEGYNQKFRELYKIGITCYLLLGLIAMLVVLETFCELHELKKFRKMFYVKKDKDEDRVHIIEHDQLSFSSIADQAGGPKEDRKQNEPFVSLQSSAHPDGSAGN
uniref:Potassium two pore domain channel subfamily K member 1 n=1 Tax=Canis lupus familiaris TaxID=9615 RepID=A0A8I3MR75_CANLF